MSLEPSKTDYATLGEYLRETRITQGKELVAVAGETKISSKSLQAIEENNFAALPADVFARGFYALYAKSLLLDPKDVLHMYTQERPRPKKSITASMARTGKLAHEVETMSERPSFMPFSLFSLLLLLMLVLGGGLCWYLSWNPATYLSQKLRSLEEPQRTEQASTNRPATGVFSSNLPPAQGQKPQIKQQDIFGISYPSTATAAVAEEISTAAPPLFLQTVKDTHPAPPR